VTGLVRAACSGAPRDLGADQARACRDAIVADLRALGADPAPGRLARLLAAAPHAGDAAFARDLARHFPHLDERLTGLCDGLECRRSDLVALTARELRDAPPDAARVAGGALELAWSERLPPTGLVVRRTEPDGGYANLTLTRPALVGALAGVNEHGLAGVVLHAAGGDAAREACRASAALLLEQCIERLDDVAKALEWCERRPGGGAALLLFADASGATAALRIASGRRERVEPPAAALVPGDGPRVRVEIAARAIAIEGGGFAPARATLASAR
jgi:hypothetical protein